MSSTPPPSAPSQTSPSTMLFLRLFFLFVSLHRVAFGDLTINTPQDLIDFSNEVNSGTSYSGTTVYLGADLNFDSSLSQQFQPIGNETYYFRGTFDGQGHIIKNLNLSSTSESVGLFGNSNGASIKNVILDESCSFSSFCSKSSSDVGSVAGYCYLCAIENVVNMASVTFTESKSVTSLKVAGIVSRIYSSRTIKNCVNYGSVTYSGTSTIGVNIGGIAGLCGGSSGNTIQNCANYGTLTHNGTSTYLYAGGITGYVMQGTNINENCVSAGKIISTTQGSTGNYIGSIVGYIYSETTVMYCLWTSNVGCSDAYGYRGSSATVTVTNSNLAALDITATNELNEYAEKNSWGKWFMLHLNGGTINNLTQDTLIVTQKHFPVPVKEGYTFSFWCMDAECDSIYDPDTTDITVITDLYTQYTQNKYAVAFDFGNGTTETKNVTYGKKYGTLPGAEERAGWTFIGWFTGEDGSGDEITSETTVSIADDHALYAQWTINNYTLTFIFDNGESDVVKTLNYSDPIYYPGDPAREGYAFDEWSPKPDTMPGHNLNITAQWTINNYTLRFILNNGESDVVKTLKYSDPIDYPGDPVREGYSFDGWSDNTTTIPAHNLNITAQWTKIYTNVTEYVEIVFDKKDLSGNEITAIISKYANDDSFTIEDVETVNGETKVTVKFTDISKAVKFAQNVNENKKDEDHIKSARNLQNYGSASSIPHVLGLLHLFVFCS